MKLTQLVQTRDVQIDILRFIGLSLIILAHVQPPELLFQLRAFDVPLMLFVSGLAFSNKNADFSLRFFVNRFKRLVIPVYLFLTVYFVLALLLRSMGIDFGIRLHHVIGSYLLMDGIGYVWVIRVFLIIGLLTPFLLIMNTGVKNDYLYCAVCLAILVITTLLVEMNIGLENIFTREFIYYALGYSVMFLLGLRFRHLPVKVKASVLSVATIAFVSLQVFDIQVNGGGISINNHKYPPTGLFLFYGILMSVASLYFAEQFTKRCRIPNVVLFIGQNTIWIYLYHIPLIQFTGFIGLNWIPRYIVVFLIATALVILQNLIVSHFNTPFLKYLKG